MVRPDGITNWALNANMLAHELRMYGGKTVVVQSENSDCKRSDFSKDVICIPQVSKCYARILNLALSRISTKYLFFLDDPLRAMPSNHFVECLQQTRKVLTDTNIGYLGVGSKMEPHTGVLATTTTNEAKTAKVTGLFAPSFALNLNALTYIGGFRSYQKSLALSCLDLSLRTERDGFRSKLVEIDKLMCPSHAGNKYLGLPSESMLRNFEKFWKRKPVCLKSKYPAIDQQVGETRDYREWVRLCDTLTEGDILSFKKEADLFVEKPLISVIMPVFDPPKKFLIKAIESVISQVYENWELCIADDASTKKFVRPLLKSYARKDSRIKVTFRKTNGHISVASNSALKLAKGEFVAFFDHDDELRQHALLEIAKAIKKNPKVNLIYSDEDKVDEAGNRYDPYFKPDWNPDLLLGQNYISHFSVFRTSLVNKFKGFRRGVEGAQDWDLILRLTEQIKGNSILHIPKILYHWRAIIDPLQRAWHKKANF